MTLTIRLKKYNAPAILHRHVSYDGTNVAEQQDFSYSTTWSTSGAIVWTSKQTIVTTTDLIRAGHPSFQTVYIYSSHTVPNPPNIVNNVANQLPVEQTITYKDWNGTTLRTVTKNWVSGSSELLASEQITLDNPQTGPTSKTAYIYGTLGLLREKDEYGFGAGTPGALTRKTVVNYQVFPVSPLSTQIYDRPCQSIVSDGSGNVFAETDVLYDGGTAMCGTPGTSSVSPVSNLPLGTHDEANYGTSANPPRGNATTVTRKCLQTCSNATTTFAYDETGQTVSMKDPCGNATCSDMTGTNHITSYSFGDSFDSPPSFNTNAYLTPLLSG